MVFALYILNHLKEQEPQLQKTACHKEIHWKDAVRMLLYHIVCGVKWSDFEKYLGIPDATAWEVIQWILAMTG